jgi:hypothetical protein
MAKKLPIRQIAELAEYLRHLHLEDVFQAEYRMGNRTGLLSRLRFAKNQPGRPARRTIECLDNGVERSFDAKYDFEFTAYIVRGQRIDL